MPKKLSHENPQFFKTLAMVVRIWGRRMWIVVWICVSRRSLSHGVEPLTRPPKSPPLSLSRSSHMSRLKMRRKVDERMYKKNPVLTSGYCPRVACRTCSTELWMAITSRSGLRLRWYLCPHNDIWNIYNLLIGNVPKFLLDNSQKFVEGSTLPKHYRTNMICEGLTSNTVLTY